MLTLRLFHGRSSPAERLAGWGVDGPTLGPLASIDLTYGGISLAAPGDEPIELAMIDELIHYDGMLYGDSSPSSSTKIAPRCIATFARPDYATADEIEQYGALSGFVPPPPPAPVRPG